MAEPEVAAVPWEAFDITHPDHNWWVEQTGRCLAPDCAEHLPEIDLEPLDGVDCG